MLIINIQNLLGLWISMFWNLKQIIKFQNCEILLTFLNNAAENLCNVAP